MTDKTWVVHYYGVPVELTSEEYTEVRELADTDPKACDDKMIEYLRRHYGGLRA